MYIAKNLKRLRLDMGLTQEELAQRIGVTGQAVSKWERDECYPDITLLPGLANCFQVTVDELLGMAEIKGKMWGVYAQANAKEVEGNYRQAAEIYDEALRNFPADLGLWAARAEALAMSGEEYDDAIRACEWFLEGDVNEKRRASTIAALCYLYRHAGMTDKAELLARSRPHARESREFLLPGFLDEAQRVAYLREHLPGLLTDICRLIGGDVETIEEDLRRITLGRYRAFVEPEAAARMIAAFLSDVGQGDGV